MHSDQVVVVAAAVAGFAAIVLVVVTVVQARQVRRLRTMVDTLADDLVPLARRARVVVDQAATELERVGDVLGSAEAVSATVDSASRLAYRAFANPAVKTVAYASGVGGALRRLFGGRVRTRP
jgi:hypothetical protein